MPFEDEEVPRSAGEATTPVAGSANGSGWGADVDAPLDSPRDKFRRDRESPERRDRFGRDYRSRSPGDLRGARRRSRSPIRRPSGIDETDRYIPQYDRDRDSGNDRYQSNNSGGRFNSRGYSGGRGSHRHSGRGDHDSSYGHGGSDMGGGRSGSMPDPRTFEQVVPFKYYAEWIKTQDGGRRMEQEDIRERYEDYRREALQRLYTQFFSVHKDDDWFCERFEPERRKEYMQKLASQKAENLRSFVSDLDSGKLDKLTLTATTEQVMQHEVNRRDLSSSNRLGGDDDDDGSESYTLFIRTVPPSVSRAVLEGELTKQPGFKHLSLSEPRQDKQYHRFGWVRFENGTDMDKTVESLSNINIDQFQFHFSRHNNVSSGIIRLTPDVSSTEERIRLDLKLAREAVKSMDEHTDREVFHMLETLQKKARDLSEAAGELPADGESAGAGDGDVAMSSDEKRVPEEGAADEDGQDDGEVKGNIAATRRELDLLLEYLRRVHYYCYYCGHTADNLEDFMRRCAKQHLRRGLPGNRSPQPSGNWTRYLDNRNDVIIHPLQAERLYKEGGKSLELETDKELDNHIKQLDEGRYRCLLCTKLFKGDAFVRKHIRNKHPEAVPETLVREISFFNNFVREAPHFVQLGTGGGLPVPGGGGMMGGAGAGGHGGNVGGGMRDRGHGFMPQMMPGMMMPGMMAAPYMMPGMMPGMVPGMMQMGGHFMNPGMMGMMGGGHGHGGMYGQQFRGGRANNGRGASSGGNRQDPRAVRSYVDLDAPAEGEADFGF
ncbi:hypothetical protein LPJ66_003111 [Kickxella alabastrina]|uniref:Uncharacterized protein n=1 Tax=Kickxella alabastrina TaxID=61397 RepID=A0ACC1IM71_9FUNG|nr:hypothetical protein LPJ66_003111 [Kickxella alabastrina]